MENYDLAIIGGGLMGCFVARNVMRYNLSALLIEKEEDVCTGISKANSAIVYSGYNTKANSFKSALTVKANKNFAELCRQLDVPFSPRGALMVSFGGKTDATLEKKYRSGQENGVPGLRLLSGVETLSAEKGLNGDVRMSLFSPTSGSANPWDLCYGAYENALANGCRVALNTEAEAIERRDDGYVIYAGKREFRVSAIVNCGGMNSDKIHEMLFPPSVKIYADANDYALLRGGGDKIGHIILRESEDKRENISIVPLPDGKILLASAKRDSKGNPGACDGENVEKLIKSAEFLLPGIIREEDVVRCFSAVRPNPYGVDYSGRQPKGDGKSINDFAILSPEPGFISLIGIKTPGMTCADELGRYVADKAAEYLHASNNPNFNPCRKGIVNLKELDSERINALVGENRLYGRIVCMCEMVSEAQIIQAINNGAVDLDGVKRRCGAMLGMCQGSRCENKIMAILSQELGIPPEKVTKSGKGTEILGEINGQI